jgi:hypothetical protein
MFNMGLSHYEIWMVDLRKKTNCAGEEDSEDDYYHARKMFQEYYRHVHSISLNQLTEENLQKVQDYSLVLLYMDEEVEHHFTWIRRMSQEACSILIIKDKLERIDIIQLWFQAGIVDFLLRPLSREIIQTLGMTCHLRWKLQEQQRQQKIEEVEKKKSLIEKEGGEDHVVKKDFRSSSLASSSTMTAITMEGGGGGGSLISTCSTGSLKPVLMEDRSTVFRLDHHGASESWETMNYNNFGNLVTPLTQDYLSVICLNPSPFPSFIMMDEKKANRILNTWDFDVYSYSADDSLKRFLIVVRANYRDNPYHNFYHAVDVLQACYYMTRYMFCDDGGSRSLIPLKSIDFLALAVAAYCHDMGHPGVNNFFMKNARTPLALLYNDRSILENYHCTMTFSLLKQTELNFLAGLTCEQWNEFRKGVLNAILATDMALHFDFIKRFQTRLAIEQEKMGEEGGRGENFSEADRYLLMAGIIKCADINNPARSFPIARRWTYEILKEYLFQGDLEKQMGYPLFTSGDRRKIDPAHSQAEFIEMIVLPLYSDVNALLSGLDVCIHNLQKNRKKWHLRMIKFMVEHGTTVSPRKDDRLSLLEEELYHSHRTHTRRVSVPVFVAETDFVSTFPFSQSMAQTHDNDDDDMGLSYPDDIKRRCSLPIEL